MFGNIDMAMIRALVPELAVLALALVVMALDLMWGETRRRALGWVTATGLALGMVASLLWGVPPQEGSTVWGGMLRHDMLAFVFQMVFLFAAAITALLAVDHETLGRRGEFYLLLLASVLGMVLLAGAADLLMVYLALETTSIPLYVMAGFLRDDEASVEAGFKYLLFGALTSAVLLYAFSLLYGFAGTTNLAALPEALQQAGVPWGVVLGVVVLALAGLAFKISAVPFHFWAPDVYQGAPTPVAGFLSTASKAAGFAVVLRVLLTAFTGPEMPYWGAMVAAIAAATMTWGNVVALLQKDIKRLLAYSSVAHAGYILLGLVALSDLGVTGAVYYLMAYLLTNLAAFGVVGVAGRALGRDDLAAYDGLHQRAPGMALALSVALLSLAGIPPLAGFVAKAWVFGAAVNAGLTWLAVVAVVNALVAAYYYFMVLRRMYFPTQVPTAGQPVQVTRAQRLALWVLCAGILVLGVAFAPWYAWARQAALVLIG